LANAETRRMMHTCYLIYSFVLSHVCRFDGFWLPGASTCLGCVFDSALIDRFLIFFLPVMPASSVAATCGDSELQDSQALEEVDIQTPELAVVSPAPEVHSWGAARPQGTAGPGQHQGTDSDLPSSEDCEENLEPSTKRLCYTYPPIWQVGIDWTGFFYVSNQ